MAELRLSQMANDDLLSIKEYIEKELNNPQAAINTLQKITKSLRLLMNFPLSGASLASVLELETDYRFVVSGNYTSFYRYTGDAVIVDRVLFAKQDCMTILFGNTDE